MAIYLDYIHQKYNANTALKEETNVFEISSVAYDEYLNRINMLENCTDNTIKPILEAQVEVLYEVGIKDIAGKIKEAIQKLIEKIKKIIEKIKDFFFNKKREGMKQKTNDLEQKLKEAEDTIVALKHQNSVQKTENEKQTEKIKEANEKFKDILDKIRNNSLLYFDVLEYMKPNQKVQHGSFWLASRSDEVEEQLQKSLDGIFNIFTDKVVKEFKNDKMEVGEVINFNGSISYLIASDCDPDRIKSKPDSIDAIYKILKKIEESDYKNAIQTTLKELKNALERLETEYEKGISNEFEGEDGGHKSYYVNYKTTTDEKGTKHYEYEKDWDGTTKHYELTNKFKGLGEVVRKVIRSYNGAIIAVNVINNEYMQQIGFADSCINTLSAFCDNITVHGKSGDYVDDFSNELNKRSIKTDDFRD